MSRDEARGKRGEKERKSRWRRGSQRKQKKKNKTHPAGDLGILEKGSTEAEQMQTGETRGICCREEEVGSGPHIQSNIDL